MLNSPLPRSATRVSKTTCEKHCQAVTASRAARATIKSCRAFSRVVKCIRPLKNAHLLRSVRPPRSSVRLKYASACRFLARLAYGTFSTGLKTGFCKRLLSDNKRTEMAS